MTRSVSDTRVQSSTTDQLWALSANTTVVLGFIVTFYVGVAVGWFGAMWTQPGIH